MNTVKILNDDFTIKEGDTKTIFRLELLYQDGTHPNLEGSKVTVYIANKFHPTVFKDMEIEGEGIVSFVLDNKDVTGKGLLDVEIVVVYPDGNRETFPEKDYLKLKVVPNLENRGIEDIDQNTYELLITKINNITKDLEEYVVESVKKAFADIDLNDIEIDLSGLSQVGHKHVLVDIVDVETYNQQEITDLYLSMFK